MKKIILCVTMIIFIASLQITAFATEGTPVELTLGDVYDITSFSLTLENTAGETTEISFTEKDEFKTVVVLSAGEYQISDCKYVSPDKTKYSIELDGTTFSVPNSTSLTKIKLLTGQKPRQNNLLDFFNESKIPIIVLCICGVVYLLIQRKQAKTVKTINPELQRMMEEHEAMQEFYQSDKIDYSQYTSQNKDTELNEAKTVNFDNEYADNSEE